MKRVIGIVLVLILAITLGSMADGLRERGVSMVSSEVSLAD